MAWQAMSYRELGGCDPLLGAGSATRSGEDLELSDDHTEMRRAFSRLSPKERELLELRLVSGLTVDEVARVLGKRAGAIRTAQSRAVANLRQLLDGARCD